MVRLVRCPRCRKVLAELADVPVYQCGGCGTILEAKTRKNGANSKEMHLQKSDPAEVDKTNPSQIHGLDHVTDDKETSSSHEADAFSSAEETSLDKKDQNDHGVYNEDGDGKEYSSSELDVSPVSVFHEKKDSSPEASLCAKQDETQNIISEDNNNDLNVCRDLLTELTSHQTENASLGVEELEELDKAENPLCQSTSISQFFDSQELSEDNELLNEVPTLVDSHPDKISQEGKSPANGIENKSLSDQDNESQQGKSGHQNNDQPEYSKRSNAEDKLDSENGNSSDVFLKPMNKEMLSHNVTLPNHEQFQISETPDEGKKVSQEGNSPANGIENKSRSDQDNESQQGKSGQQNNDQPECPKRSKAEDKLDSENGNSSDVLLKAMNEEVLSHNVTLPNHQQFQISHRTSPSGFDHLSSVDENLSQADPGSELHPVYRHMSKFPTRSYYGYDGSESSGDGNDHMSKNFSWLSERKSKDANVRTSRFHRKEPIRVNKALNRELEIKHQEPSSSSVSWRDSYHPTKASMRHGHEIGNRINLEDMMPKMPYNSSSHVERITGNTSSYRRTLLPNHSGYHSPNTRLYPEPDHIELLRKIYELEEKLNRVHIQGEEKGRFGEGVVRKERHARTYSDHLTPERGLSFQRYGQEKVYPQQTKRMCFSGEAAYFRRQVNCLHPSCHLKVHSISAGLPSHSLCCTREHCRAHPSQAFYGVHCSSSPSPQHYASSKISLWGEEKFDGQIHRCREMKRLQLKEKYDHTRRHLRPIAGGAPLIACYYCSKLLQLPLDFAFQGRRCLRLKCYACSKVMKFSIFDGTHIVPDVPDASAPPPSEVDDFADSIKPRNLAPASHSNYCHHAEPVSYSDDYGTSFCRSCSTEGEPSNIAAPLRQLERSKFDTKIAAINSNKLLEERNMRSAVGNSQDKGKNLAVSYDNESGGPSSPMSKWRKQSSEIEELPPPANSPLHRLMGYSSPSEMMND